MAKPVQILQIDPPTELVFKGPFTDVVTSYLKLTNPSDKQVCFKVKTTAPKQYCVRPNSGLIPSNGHVSVAVMLQPIDLSVEQERSKHKFMVQSAYVPPNETSLENIWKNTSLADLMDSKLRVVFESPDMHESNIAPDKAPKAGVSPAKSGIDSELRKEIDERKRLEGANMALRDENSELRQRVKRIEASTGGGGAMMPESSTSLMSDSGLSLVHVALMVLAALLLGLIFGKLF